METQAYSDQAYKQLFGLKKVADQRFTEDLIGALQQIDRGLLPPSATHPFGGLIIAGSDSIDELVGLVEGG